MHRVQGAGAGGLQGLLKAAQQKHTTAQRAPAAAPVSPAPAGNSKPPEPTPTGGAAALLTPAFFEQQQQQRVAVPPPASSLPDVQDVGAGASPLGAANGPGQGANPLQQLLSRCVKGSFSPLHRLMRKSESHAVCKVAMGIHSSTTALSSLMPRQLRP